MYLISIHGLKINRANVSMYTQTNSCLQGLQEWSVAY